MELFNHAENGNMVHVQENDIPIDYQNTDYLALIHALWRGHRNIAKNLIESGCRVNKMKSSTTTPLHIAIKQKDTEIVNILLARGAIIERIDRKGMLPLYLAVQMRENEIINLIIQNLRDISNHSSTNKLSSLHITMLEDEAQTVRDMFKSEEVITISVNDPLISTAEYWNSYQPHIIEVLSDDDANTNTKDLAVFIKNENSIDLIMKKHRMSFKNNDSINDKANTGFSHFHIACMLNKSHVVTSFLKIGVEINTTISETSSYWPGYSPLHFAVEHHCLNTAKLLLSSNADVNLKNSKGLTPLHIAVKHNQIDAVRLLLKYGANINIQDSNNRSPLHLSLELEYLSITNVILEEYKQFSFSINPVDNREISHFHIACIRNYPHVVEGFLKNGVNINVPIMINDKQWPGFTALNLAVTFGNTETVKTLLSFDKNNSIQDGKGLTLVNLNNRYGSTSLHIAIKNDWIDCVRLLLEYGANVNAQNSINLSTPLHLAMYHMNFDIIHALLELGADTNIRDKNGRTPLHTLSTFIKRKRENSARVCVVLCCRPAFVTRVTTSVTGLAAAAKKTHAQA